MLSHSLPFAAGTPSNSASNVARSHIFTPNNWSGAEIVLRAARKSRRHQSDGCGDRKHLAQARAKIWHLEAATGDANASAACRGRGTGVASAGRRESRDQAADTKNSASPNGDLVAATSRDCAVDFSARYFLTRQNIWSNEASSERVWN
jgi:hypothetical protein